MTKDGLAEKVSRDLHRLYDDYAREALPPDWLRMLDDLN